MQSEWANSGTELFLELGSAPGLRAGLEEGLREAIRSGRLPRGARLPATRTLARDLGVSRGTVLAAYSQLATEGWIRGSRGSATTVAVDGDEAGASVPATPPTVGPRFDLRPGRPDPSSFPRAEWLRALRRALAATPHDTLGYGSPQGHEELRSELAAYLRRARGLRVGPANLVVTTGFTQGLNLVARALADTGARRIAMEEPSMAHHRRIVRAAGLDIVPLAVDGEGARVDELPSGIGAVLLTPNRQHPLGVTLSAARRARLLDWARATDGLVVEDDYDGEFRYDGHPIGALQSLEPRAVVYAGTVSKTLAPGVRLGWLAVPDTFLAHVVRVKELSDWHNGVLEQLAFAELL
ncbi:MAG: GntR family transcriptional regulator / MocR family aminotransferase, partial [Gaiellaceae bacterium]|nr:GntR family transcriptional regulator / MocR family aminotransferase [Gaiellaceae bacterium]